MYEDPAGWTALNRPKGRQTRGRGDLMIESELAEIICPNESKGLDIYYITLRGASPDVPTRGEGFGSSSAEPDESAIWLQAEELVSRHLQQSVLYKADEHTLHKSRNMGALWITYGEEESGRSQPRTRDTPASSLLFVRFNIILSISKEGYLIN